MQQQQQPAADEIKCAASACSRVIVKLIPKKILYTSVNTGPEPPPHECHLTSSITPKNHPTQLKASRRRFFVTRNSHNRAETSLSLMEMRTNAEDYTVDKPRAFLSKTPFKKPAALRRRNRCSKVGKSLGENSGVCSPEIFGKKIAYLHPVPAFSWHVLNYPP